MFVISQEQLEYSTWLQAGLTQSKYYTAKGVPQHSQAPYDRLRYWHTQKEKQRQACMDSRCGLCGCVALWKPSQACLLEIYLFWKIWSENFKKLFSAEAGFLIDETPVFHHNVFKFLYHRVVCSDKSTQDMT